MTRADAEALRIALAIAGLLGLAWLAAAVLLALEDEQRARLEAAALRADVAAWQVSQVLENVRQITAEAAARPELAP